MCGPSKQEGLIAGQAQNFTTMLNSNYQQNFGAQSAILQNLTNQFTPIAEAGPDQQGFGPQQLAAMTTQATQGVGQNYAAASRALAGQQAGQGGGGEVLPTGAAVAEKGQLASAAANQMSSEQLAITNANYAQGRQNWQSATGGLAALSQQYDPTAYAGQEIASGKQSFGEAQQVQEEKNQEQMAIAGGIASVAAPFLGMIPGVGGAISSGVSALGKGLQG